MAQGASLFRLLNILVGVVLFVHIGSWNSGILGVFVCIFGILTFALEFTIPEAVVYNMGFMFSMLGRGIFYVCMGLLCLSWKWFNIVVGCIVMVVGLFYIAMHFKGATPSPSMSAVPSTNMNSSYNTTQYTSPPDMVQSYQNADSGTYHGDSTRA
ncbi:MAG: COPI associated protein-domain-containing protein [Benniella sp.]|nr:MAG: COPI associated protein-domain-containing protein [Benniella sp.]